MLRLARLPSAAAALAALALVAAAAAPAAAGTIPSLVVTIDENGNGVTVFGSQTFPFTGTLAPDPGPGGLSLALTYSFPTDTSSFVAGDVLLQDGIDGPVLDVVRFNPAGTGGNRDYPDSIVFYSDNTDGFDSLADTPSPPGALYDNNVTIQEVGPEGANGAIYTPTDGQPGFFPGAPFPITYVFISDSPLAVPEPASVTLLGLGVAGIGLRAWRRKPLA